MQLHAHCAAYYNIPTAAVGVYIALLMYIKFGFITLFVPIFRVSEQCVKRIIYEIRSKCIYKTAVKKILMLQFYCVHRLKIAQQQLLLSLSAADNIHINGQRVTTTV